jgi:excisionase family DNA binding protein
MTAWAHGGGEHGDDHLMTRADVAAHLRVSLSTVDRLRLAGELGTVVHVGRRAVRFHRADVLAYVKRGDAARPT